MVAMEWGLCRPHCSGILGRNGPMAAVATQQLGRTSGSAPAFGPQGKGSRFPCAGRGLDADDISQFQFRKASTEVWVVALSGVRQQDTPVHTGRRSLPNLLQRNREPGLRPSARRSCVHRAAAGPCSRTSEDEFDRHALRLAPHRQDRPQGVSVVGLAQTIVCARNNSTTECSFVTQ